MLSRVRGYMDRQSFHDALRSIWDVVSDANKYVDTTAPWGLKKTDPARMGEVLAVLAEIIRQAAILVQPVMPNSANKILDQLGVAEDQRGFDVLAGARRIVSGVEISKPEPVFPRYVDEEDEA